MTRFYLGWPAAAAKISGGTEAPEITGTVSFYPSGTNTMVIADIQNLPQNQEPCQSGILGFHLHEGLSCGGVDFAETRGHFNPENCPHPYHAGDFPPLFQCGSNAFLAFLTDRFQVADVVGRTVVIHSNPDDFTTQPSGNSGNKIACGVIKYA